jgi:hypothetical protein
MPAMSPSKLVIGLTVASSLALAACVSGSDTGAVDSNGAGGLSARTPTVHRAPETPCTGDRPPGFGGFGDPADACATDSDCAAGTNGRCVGALGEPALCSYDDCSADADCGSVMICECRNLANYEANTCVHGACRLDADCGVGGFCSPSAVTVTANGLTGIAQGSIGYFYHQPADYRARLRATPPASRRALGGRASAQPR